MKRLSMEWNFINKHVKGNSMRLSLENAMCSVEWIYFDRRLTRTCYTRLFWYWKFLINDKFLINSSSGRSFALHRNEWKISKEKVESYQFPGFLRMLRRSCGVREMKSRKSTKLSCLHLKPRKFNWYWFYHLFLKIQLKSWNCLLIGNV